MKQKTTLLGLFTIIFLSTSLSFGGKAKKAPQLAVLTVKQYTKLKPAQRTAYIKGIKKAWLKFETSYGPQEFVRLSSPWIEASYAAGESGCVIGGNFLLRVGGKCSTRKNPCLSEGSSDPKEGFRCGPLYQNKCISRTPIDDISIRCQAGLPAGQVLPSGYQNVFDFFTKNYRNQGFCKERDLARVGSGCHTLHQDIEVLKTRFGTEGDEAVSSFGAENQGACGSGLNPFCPNTISIKGSSFSDFPIKTKLCGNPELILETPDTFTRRIFKNKDGKPCQTISKGYEAEPSLDDKSKNVGRRSKFKGKCNQIASCIKDATRRLRKNITAFAKENSKALTDRGFCKSQGRSGSLGCPTKEADNACKPLTRVDDSPCKNARISYNWGDVEFSPDYLLGDISSSRLLGAGKHNDKYKACTSAISKCLKAVDDIKKVAQAGTASRTLCGGLWKAAAGAIDIGPYSAQNAVINDASGKKIASITVNNDFKGVTIASAKRSGAALRIPAGSDNFDIQAWSQKEGGVQTGAVSAPRNLACSDAPPCSNPATDSKVIDLNSNKDFAVKAGKPLCVKESSDSDRQRSQGSGTAQ